MCDKNYPQKTYWEIYFIWVHELSSNIIHKDEKGVASNN